MKSNRPTIFLLRCLAIVCLLTPGLGRAGPRAYISNYLDNTVTVIDAATDTVIDHFRSLPDGDLGPWGVAVRPGGKEVYFSQPHFRPFAGGDSVAAIGTSANHPKRDVAVGRGALGIAFDPSGRKVYQVNSDDGSITAIRVGDKSATTLEPGLNYPFGIAAASVAGGVRLYVTENGGNSVAVVDPVLGTVLSRISVGRSPTGIAVNPSSTRVYVANYQDHTVSVINTATDEVIRTTAAGYNPLGVAVNPSGSRVYVANQTKSTGGLATRGTVSVIDARTNTEIARVRVGPSPSGIAVTPDGRRVYVANTGGNTVSVIAAKLPKPKVVKTVKVGAGPVAFGAFIGSFGVDRIAVLVDGFTDDIAGGHVDITDMSGNVVEQLSGDIGPGGLFEVHRTVHLPEKFMVQATALRTVTNPAAESDPQPLPGLLQAVVDDPGDELVIRVTPLTALVARYAISTGQSLRASKAGIRAYLELPSYLDPCELVPDSIAPGRGTPFSFLAFREAWKASGLGFMEFLDFHVDRARKGMTTNEFIGAGEEKSWGYWLKKAITKGGGSWAISEGIGWTYRAITGAASLDEIRDQLNYMQEQLDFLGSRLTQIQASIENLLIEVRLEQRYQSMLTAVTVIENSFDKLQFLPRFKDKSDAMVWINDIEKNSTAVDNGMKEIHNRVMSKIAGVNFYEAYADYVIGQVRAGKSLEAMMEKYAWAFRSVSGAQAEGLVLVVEHYQKVMPTEEGMRLAVENEIKKYTARMSEQSEAFMDAAERIMVAVGPNGGGTLDYHVGALFPVDGDSPLYALVDARVGDVMAAESQLVTRLTWDESVIEIYPGTEWNESDTAPKNYPEIFGFMRDRMRRLAAVDKVGKGAALAIYLVTETGYPGEAIYPMGTLNAVEVKRYNTKGVELGIAKVKVLRHIFRDFLPDFRYTVVPDPTQAEGFQVAETDMKVRGTVGPRVFGPPPANDKTSEITVMAFNDHPYLTVPLLAWVPPYLLARPDRPTDANRFLYSSRKANNAAYFIKSEGYQYLSSPNRRPAAIVCNDPKTLFRHTLWRPDAPENDIIRYDIPFRLTIDNGPSAICWSLWSLGYAAELNKFATYFLLHPVPDLVRRFVKNPAAVTAPQVEMAVNILAYPGWVPTSRGYMREGDYCGSLWNNGTERDGPQRWSFERW